MAQTSSTVGLLHPGEMGSAVGATLVAGGARVLWSPEGRSPSTRARAAELGLEATGSLARVTAAAGVIVSVTPPHAALTQAREVAALGFRGIYVDANAVAPATARAIGEIVEAAGARFVDGGIIGPANRKPGAARIYLSGPSAPEVAPLFASGPIDAHVLSGPAGAASALKVGFAGWNKASQGLLAAIRAFAIAEGVDAALLAEWKISMPDVPARSERAVQDNARKAWRFVGEMEEIAQAFAAVGLPPASTRPPPTFTAVSRATRTPPTRPPSRRPPGVFSSAAPRPRARRRYASETMACCGAAARECIVLRPKPARRSRASSSAKVKASPAGVVQSITRLKLAAGAGDTRSALGTNSSVTARPPGVSARWTLASSRSQVTGSKWWRKLVRSATS